MTRWTVPVSMLELQSEVERLRTALADERAHADRLAEALEVVRTNLPQHLAEHPDRGCRACTENGSGLDRHDECQAHAALSDVGDALQAHDAGRAEVEP